MATKSLDPEARERLCALVETIVERDFDGNKTAAAKKLGVSQSYISEMVQRRRGPGSTMLEALADYTRKSVDELLGRTVRYDPGQIPYVLSTAIGQHPDWPSARDEALRLYGRTIDPDILAKVENASLGEPLEFITPELVKRLHDTIADAEAEKARRRAAAKNP